MKRSPGKKGKTSPASANVAPKAHTMAAPVGRSKANDAVNPTALVNVPEIHPIASCLGSDEANITPIAAGGIKKEKKSSNPAGATRLGKTTPKGEKKKKYHKKRPERRHNWRTRKKSTQNAPSERT